MGWFSWLRFRREDKAPTKPRTVQCSQHGEQPETFVCQHIVQGLREDVPYGFWWSREAIDEKHPDAWCTICNENTAANDWEWTANNLEITNV